MKKIILVLALAATSFSVQSQTKKPVTKPVTKPATTTTTTLKNLKDSTSYALGVNIARNLKAQNLDNIDAMLLYKGLNDVLTGKTASLKDEDAMRCVNQYVQQKNSAKSSGAKAAGKKFMAENAKRPGVKSMPGGWQYEIIKESTSTEHPTIESTVKCHYHGTLIDGTVFDSSVDRGEPISFPLKGVIKGWQIAVPMMTVGSKWKIYLPSDLAYGDNGSGDKIAPGATLVFEIELLGIEK